MIQRVKLENGEIAVLDSKQQYSGAQKPEKEDRVVRKAIGLPVTKQLVYYTNKKDPASSVNIIWYRLAEMYDSLSRWYTIEAALESGEIVRIHSSYLIEMQYSNFVTEMAQQEAYYAKQELWRYLRIR